MCVEATDSYVVKERQINEALSPFILEFWEIIYLRSLTFKSCPYSIPEMYTLICLYFGTYSLVFLFPFLWIQSYFIPT